MHAQECKTIGRSGACSPKKFSEIRCPEIASEAILGQKHSRTSYGSPQYCIEFLAVYVGLVKPADFESTREGT